MNVIKTAIDGVTTNLQTFRGISIIDKEDTFILVLEQLQCIS